MRRLGPQIKASEPAPKVIADNSDLVQAAENYRAERFVKFGEMIGVKAAILKVSAGRR